MKPAGRAGRGPQSAPEHACLDRADFLDPARHGFARVAVAVPRCRVADPAYNAAHRDHLHVELGGGSFCR